MPQPSTIAAGCSQKRYVLCSPSTDHFIDPCGSRVVYPPEHWHSFVHPEGQRYYVQKRSKFDVIVDVNIQNPQIRISVLSWVKRVEDAVVACNTALPNGGVELFLKPNQSEDAEWCSYYFASYSTQTIFWLTQVETGIMGMGPVVSEVHSCAFQRLIFSCFWLNSSRHGFGAPLLGTCRVFPLPRPKPGLANYAE